MVISSEKLSDAFLEVNSCGRQFLTDRDYKMVRENGRMDYHILYIEKGACLTEINGQKKRIAEGNLILFKPYEKQVYGFKASDNSISCYIHFSGTSCAELLHKFGLFEDRISYVGTNNSLESIFSEMESEYLLKSPFFTDTCASLLLHFLATAGRLKQYKLEDINLKSRKSIEMVCKYMHTHYDQNHNLEFYAEMCHLSVSRFTHLFKEHTGKTPKAYMLNIKVSIAKKMLSSTDLSISDISGIIGVDDVNYFSRMIKKHTGHSPKHFRD